MAENYKRVIVFEDEDGVTKKIGTEKINEVIVFEEDGIIVKRIGTRKLNELIDSLNMPSNKNRERKTALKRRLEEISKKYEENVEEEFKILKTAHIDFCRHVVDKYNTLSSVAQDILEEEDEDKDGVTQHAVSEVTKEQK